jgi:hypothetical protein
MRSWGLFRCNGRRSRARSLAARFQLTAELVQPETADLNGPGLTRQNRSDNGLLSPIIRSLNLFGRPVDPAGAWSTPSLGGPHLSPLGLLSVKRRARIVSLRKFGGYPQPARPTIRSSCKKTDMGRKQTGTRNQAHCGKTLLGRQAVADLDLEALEIAAGFWRLITPK